MKVPTVPLGENIGTVGNILGGPPPPYPSNITDPVVTPQKPPIPAVPLARHPIGCTNQVHLLSSVVGGGGA